MLKINLMMMQKIIWATAILLIGTSAYAEKKDNIHMFPQADEGFVRHVVEVPKTDNDYDHRVELMIGKNMLVDCNHHSLRAKIENITLKGWGYKYLKISDIHSGPSTMMACSEAKTEKFITVAMGKETLRRYNHRSPIVIYVSKGYEVRYRIWSAGDEVNRVIER